MCRYEGLPVDPSTIDLERNLSQYRYTLTADGDLSFARGAHVEFPISRLGGVTEPSEVIVMKRQVIDTGVFSTITSSFDASTGRIRAEIFAPGEIAFTSSSNPLPVDLRDLEAQVNGDHVMLRWQTLSETGTDGFRVERRVEERGDETGWTRVGFVNGAGTRRTTTDYRFADADVPYGAETAAYRLRQVDVDGSESVSDPVRVAFGAPSELRLRKTFPNPAVARVTVRYETPRAAPVQMDLYNVLGQRVRQVHRGEVPAGRHHQQVDVSGLSSGVYFLRIVHESDTAT